jgi:hypothetical protein
LASAFLEEAAYLVVTAYLEVTKFLEAFAFPEAWEHSDGSGTRKDLTKLDGWEFIELLPRLGFGRISFRVETKDSERLVAPIKEVVGIIERVARTTEGVAGTVVVVEEFVGTVVEVVVGTAVERVTGTE